MRTSLISSIFVLALLSSACTPTVQLEHEIYIKVDKELDNLFDESSGLF